MAARSSAEATRRKSSLTEVPGPEGVKSVNIAELNNADRALAAKFGYMPVLKRKFGSLSTFSFAVSVSGLFATVTTTFSYPLAAGGSASVVWSWLICGAGCMCIALSVSEIVSAYPTCGGLCYTVSRLVPQKYIAPVSWVTGWLNLLGQIAAVASSEWGAAALLLAVISIATDFAYLPSEGQTVGVMAGLTCITGLVNSLSTYWIEKLTRSYVIFHIVVLVTCSVALLAMAQPSKGTGTPKHDAAYVFTNIDNVTGWTPNGWSFLFGFLSVSWIMTDYDATAHITEETNDPEVKAPWAISMAMFFTYIAGFLFNIVLCFVMGDPAAILASEIEQPVAQIFFNVLGKGGGITFTLCAFIIMKFVTFTAAQSLARTVFSFSRDRLIPFPDLWTKILPLTGTPILAVWISVFWCIAINLIGLSSYTAILGVFNVTAIALDWSYCIPIFCKIFFRQFKPGPWHLGKFSVFINAWACIWTVFVSIIFIMPTVRPVTAENMNWAIVYLMGILGLSMAYWFVCARKWYKGPLIEVENLLQR